MGLPADRKLEIFSLGDISGGLNINDPAISLNDNQVADCLNVIFLKKGFRRWLGCVNLTAKDAVNDYLRGLFSHGIIAGTQFLYGVWGGKVYSINKSTGAVGTAIYDLTGTGEAWGSSHWGKFYMCNGAACCKIESGSAYSIGITAPTSGTSALAAGGSLAVGVYKIKIGYARKVGGLNVLYSQGYELTSRTTSGGNLTIALTSLPDSTDSQVNNKIVWMTNAGGETYYYYGETGDNTTTSINITSDANKNNAIIYDTFAQNNGLPGAFTFMYAFDNRLWGIIGNNLYYSQKATVSYDLEKFPTNNKIEFPYQLTGIFSLGTNLYLNTADNGIMFLPNADVGSRYQHLEQRESFAYMRTIADWNGGKIGLTKDKIGFFDGEKFSPFDYGYNIRPALNKIWSTSETNFMPCGFTYRRDNRIEYHLSFRDASLCTSNNNTTYVLNLSQTFFQDSNNFRTPWEKLDRGFNYVCVDFSNQAVFGQSFLNSSTIYNEHTTSSTKEGIYTNAGVYLTAEENLTAMVTYRTIIKNMFTVISITEIAALFQVSSNASISIVIADDLSKSLTQQSVISNATTSLWDVMQWDVGTWATESQEQYKIKGKQGNFGKSWYFVFSQTANDLNMLVTQFDILTTLMTGRKK